MTRGSFSGRGKESGEKDVRLREMGGRKQNEMDHTSNMDCSNRCPYHVVARCEFAGGE